MLVKTSGRAIGPDLLRALAILLVMSWHLRPQAMPPGVWTCWGQFGWLGVDIFFVLSGYLISTELLKPVQAGQRPDFPAFFIKRAFRILPAFWLVLAVYFLLPELREGPSIAPLWRFLTFTMNFGLDVRTARAFSHAWSLCVEEHFYLALPLVLWFWLRWKWRWLPLILAVAIIGGGMVLRDQLWRNWHAAGGHPTDFMKSLYYPSYTRLDGLVMGTSLAAVRLFWPKVWQRLFHPGITFALSILFLGIGLALTVQEGFILKELGAVVLYPSFALGVTMLLACLLRLEPYLRPLRWTGLPFIAMISYSMYLSQKLVFHADERWLSQSWLHGWSGMLIYYSSVIVVGTVLYFTVERASLLLRRVLLQKLRSKTPEVQGLSLVP